jgi:hypothetical protein
MSQVSLGQLKQPIVDLADLIDETAVLYIAADDTHFTTAISLPIMTSSKVNIMSSSFVKLFYTL